MTSRGPVGRIAHLIRSLGMVLAMSAVAGPSVAAGQGPDEAGLRLARLLSAGAVLQRDAPIPIRGWARAGTAVTVAFDGESARATADDSGAWQVMLEARPAGGPFSLVVQADEDRIEVENVLLGDVWIASGQSNMEFPVANANDAEPEIAGADDRELRQYKVPISWSWTPEATLVGGEWAPADPEHVGQFTAVGYFFARELRTAVDVPIGLVNTSWGGSGIEAWMSREAMGLDDAAWAAVQQKEAEYEAEGRAALRERLGGWPTEDMGLVNGEALWADPALDDGDWSTIAVPGTWERAGYDGLDGTAWYRTSFTLTDEEAGLGARLSLGGSNDSDITWVNGVEVGRSTGVGFRQPRVYDVPAADLHGGRNVVAVRLVDDGGPGGMFGQPDQVHLEIGGDVRPLAGDWRFRVAIAELGEDAQHVNKIPTILYNRMLHPLLPFPIKGVLWYQGESNANNEAQAMAYGEQFIAMIRGWRQEWGGNSDAFPFLWAQLPNYGTVDSIPPTAAAWARLRESQSEALALPNTGQAVTIDIGDPGNIHPTNKQDVGLRLALLARSIAYGQDVEWSGPAYRSHSVEDGRVVIEFDHAGDRLVAADSEGSVRGFAVAGPDRRFVWANAVIDEDRVIVSSPEVDQPVAVRYAWGDSPPEPNLYNGDGLPAAPFRTDDW